MLPKTVNYSCCLQFAQNARGAGFLSEQAKEDTLQRYGGLNIRDRLREIERRRITLREVNSSTDSSLAYIM